MEVFHENVWGSVCDDAWDVNDAIVACNALGFILQSVNVSVAMLPVGELGVWLDNVDCLGYEQSLTECAYLGWGGSDCISDESVYLNCTYKNTSDTYEGE